MYFIGHKRHKLFWGIFIFMTGFPPSIFCCCYFLADVLSKGLFLTSTTQTLPIFNSGNCSVDVFFIFGCKLLADFQCGIDLCMTDGYNFSSIVLTFLYQNFAIKNANVTSKAYVGDNMFNRYSDFRFIRICQWNTGFYPKHLLHWCSRRLETPLRRNSCVAKNVWVFHTIFYSFYDWRRKNCWLNAAMSGRVVHN